MEEGGSADSPATPPLDLATTVQTSQIMSSSSYWSLGGDQGGGVYVTGDQAAGVFVSGGENILLHSEAGGVLVHDGGVGLDLGGSVTRIVSVADLAKLGLNLSQADISRLNGLGISPDNSELLTSNLEAMKTMSGTQSFSRSLEDLGPLDSIDLPQTRYTSRGGHAEARNPSVSPRMLYREANNSSSCPGKSGVSLSDKLSLGDMRLVLQEQAGLSLDQQMEIMSEAALSKSCSTVAGEYFQETGGETRGRTLIEQVRQETRAPAGAGRTLIEQAGQSMPNHRDLHPAKQLDEEEGGLINRVVDRTFPAVIQEEIFTDYRTGSGHDAVWRCKDGGYKVHKFILAISSPYLKMMMTDAEEAGTVISTPDLSSRVVKSILCLLYTGKVNIGWDILSEVNSAFKLIGFSGDNVTVRPTCKIKNEDEERIPECEPASDYLEVQLEAKKRRKRNRYDSEDDFVVGDSAFDDEILGSDDEDWTPKKFKKRLKSEKDSEEEEEEEDSRYHPANGLRRGRKSLKTPDSHECFRTRGPGKGERSYKLAEDLFDGRHTDFIYVCHGCYEYFDTEKKLTLHKEDRHNKETVRGPCHTANPKEFKCLSCSSIIYVKHLVWFVKHLKFCGKDDDLANQLISPDDYSSDDEDNPVFKKKYTRRLPVDMLKDTAVRLRITGEQKGKNLQTLSKMLVGEVVDYIWGCRTCYSVFVSEQLLDTHIKEIHSGKSTAGKCWNESTENYSCQHCHQVQHSRHLVWFIYHMNKCLLGNSQMSIKKEENEEDETDEDTTEDTTDPEGIVNKPYRVCNGRSEWICQALFGRIIPVLYPCHVCYSVFIGQPELQQHFRGQHPGEENSPDQGVFYHREEDCYQCPACLKSVCKNQKNSIYFTYHYRKCNGQTFPVEKACPDCGKVFNVYQAFKHHVNTSCETREFICNICYKVFPSSTRLNYHVQYVHSAFKPFNCVQCDKSYKRRPELLEHEEMSHSQNFNYSCDKCGKQFYGKKNLALHMKTHYTEEEKKHVCSICGYRFAKVKFLKNHLTTHSDVRQFSCEVCGARVKTRDTLKQHRKKLHNLHTPVPKTALVLDPVTGLQQTVFIKDEDNILGLQEDSPL